MNTEFLPGKIIRSALVLLTAAALTGCSTSQVPILSELFPGDESAAETSDAAAQKEEKEPQQPAMVINETQPEPEEEPEEAAVSEDVAEPEGFHGYVLTEEEENDPRVRCMETASENEVSLVFAGDIVFDEGYSNMNTFKSNGQGIRGVLSGNLMDAMNSADIFMINNEFPYTESGSPLPNKKFTFKVKPAYSDELLEMGTDIVSLANNHAFDQGEQALIDTMDLLDEKGIAYVGAGRNIEEAKKPFYFIAGGMKIGYVSATQIERTPSPDTREATEDSAGVLRTLDPTTFCDVIREAKEHSDFVVVYVHWGTENTYTIEGSQRDLAAAYEEAGADLIIGDHPHNLQGVEYINDTPIIYSMGNFWFNSKDLDTGLFKAVVTTDGIKSVQFLPCRQKGCQTTLYEKGDSEYDRILGVMLSLSDGISINEDGVITQGADAPDCIAPSEPRALVKSTYAEPDPTALLLPGASTDGTVPAADATAVQVQENAVQ